MTSTPPIKANKLIYDDMVRSKDTPNIVGSWTDAQGNVVVTVLDDSPEALQAVPREPSVIIQKGERYRALESQAVDPGAKFRPAPGGVSVGHYAITAGTHGGWFNTVTAPDRYFILSNAHVLANENAGKPGDAIYQPGKYHGGGPADTIARLTASIKLENTARNLVDAAIAEVIDPKDVDLNILGIGRVYGVLSAILNQDVYKYGARTNLSRGRIIAIDAVVEVGYETRTRVFEDCVVSDIYSGPGDSGSLICDLYNNCAVATLFAGGNGVTIACKFENVQRLLGLGIIPFTEILRGLIVDMSHWQWPVNIHTLNYAENNFKANIRGATALSFSKMKARNVFGIIAKAFQPPDIYDDAFGPYCDFAEQAEILKTAYCFCDPIYSWRDHLNGLKQAIGDRKMDFSVMWDWEYAHGVSPTAITSLYQNLNKATQDWQGKPAINYTSPSWYNANILAFNATPEFPFNDYDLPLMIASWTETGLSPLLPTRYQNNGSQQVVWQVGPRDIGEAFGVASKQLDLCRFYPGFRKLLFTENPPPPLDTFTLNVSIVGQGSVTPANGNLPKDSTVTLNASAASGWSFISWTGDLISTENPVTLVMDTNKAITATFEITEGPKPAEYIYYKGTALIQGQNIRRVPTTTDNSPIGFLNKDQAVVILKVVRESSERIWAWIGYDYVRKCEQYAAIVHDGTKFMNIEMSTQTKKQRSSKS